MRTLAAQPRPWRHWPEALSDVIEGLFEHLGLLGQDTGLEHLQLAGPAPQVASPFDIAPCMAVAMATAAASATAYGTLRGVGAQRASLNLRTALAHVHAEQNFNPTLNGRPLASAMVRDNPLLATPYRCQDGVWIMPSALHPQQQLAWLRFLGVPPEQGAVAHAIGRWHGDALETGATQRGLAAALCRSQDTWRSHPQGQMLQTTPVITLHTRGHIVPQAPERSARPLEGVRVLSLTQGMAGPLAGRTLAEQGADVLHLGHPEGFEHEAVWCEAYVGCRSMGLSLKEPSHIAHAENLMGQADVLLVSLRPSAQQALGLTEELLRRRHPGLIQVRLSAYGAHGPWSNRPGFDMNAMAATGMMLQQAAYDDCSRPKLPPTTLLNDFIMGYLAASGACAALHRRARLGDVCEVQLNLARTAMWVQDLKLRGACARLVADSTPVRAVSGGTPLGVLRRLAPGVVLHNTPGAWPEPWLVPRVSLPPQSAWPER